MVAHVEAEHLLLEGQALRLVELVVGNGDALVGSGPLALGAEAREQVELSFGFSPATTEDAVDDLLEHHEQPASGVAEAVEGTALDE